MARVVGSDAAESFLLGAPPSEAERIFTAVEEMAEQQRGFVRRMPEPPRTFGLYIDGYVVLFGVDDAGDIRVDAIRPRVVR